MTLIDAVIDSWASEQIALLLGDGNGMLRDGPQFPAGPGSDMPLRSADLNHDWAPDEQNQYLSEKHETNRRRSED